MDGLMGEKEHAWAVEEKSLDIEDMMIPEKSIWVLNWFIKPDMEDPRLVGQKLGKGTRRNKTC